MPEATVLPQARFARAGKKARRAPRAEAVPEARPERVPPLAKLLLACAAVVAAYAWVRIAFPLPWSYDEYYHLGLAREMLTSGLRITSFRWTPYRVKNDTANKTNRPEAVDNNIFWFSASSGSTDVLWRQWSGTAGTNLTTIQQVNAATMPTASMNQNADPLATS